MTRFVQRYLGVMPALGCAPLRPRHGVTASANGGSNGLPRLKRAAETPWANLAAFGLGATLAATALSRPGPPLPAPQPATVTAAEHASQWTVVTADYDVTAPIRMTRTELSARFGLAARDARLLLAAPGPALLLPRQRAVLLRLRPSLRAVISASEAWVPAPDGDQFAAALRRHLEVHTGDPPAFELCAFDVALELECAAQAAETAALETAARHAVARLLAKPAAASLDAVRRVKGDLGAALSAATGLESELARLLDDDSDLRALQVSVPAGQHREGDADVQAVEDLLETYRSEAAGLAARLRAADEAAQDAEACVAASQDAQRNAVLRVSLCFSAAAFTERLWGATARALAGRRGAAAGVAGEDG